MIVTGSTTPLLPALPLLPAVQRTIPGPPGRVALRLLPEGRLAGPPPHRRLVRALLQDAAEAGGGTVIDTTTGEMLLLGTMAGAAQRVLAVLAALAPEAPPPRLWSLPGDAAPLLAWAATAGIASPAPAGPPASAGLAALDARMDALPADRVLCHRGLVQPGAAVPGRGRRLRLSRGALMAELGPLAADSAVLAHAADRLAGRLLPALAVWARDLPGWRLLPMAHRSLPPPAVVPGLFGVLPLAATADPALTERRRAMAGRGWGLALEGMDAAALALVRPAGLPADLVLLRWSPALEDGASLAALRDMPPERLMLTGCDGPAALAWAARRGVAAATGPAVEAAA
jgi:hypothetical protein